MAPRLFSALRYLKRCRLAPCALSPLLLILSFATGCGSDNLKPSAPIDADRLYWMLDLNHHAVTLSTTQPYDTLTIVAVPRTLQGTALADFPVPQYRSTDLDHLVVTPEGLLRAIGSRSEPIVVVATLTVGNLKHSDSVFVKIVDNAAPPVLAEFSVHPVPPDSAKFSAQTQGSRMINPPFGTLPARARSAEGGSMDSLVPGGLPMYFRSSDPSIAAVNRVNGVIDAHKPGAVTFYASATAFGIAKADTVSYHIGWPILANIVIGKDFLNPSTVVIGVGGLVDWEAIAAGGGDESVVDTLPTDITFTQGNVANIAAGKTYSPWANHTIFGFPLLFLGCNERDCDGEGNVVITPPLRHAVRVFTAPGTYTFYSTRYGLGGQVIVLDE